MTDPYERHLLMEAGGGYGIEPPDCTPPDEGLIERDVDAMSIPEILADIDALGMGFGAWLGSWGMGDGYECREPGDQYVIEIYPVNEHVEWAGSTEPYAREYGGTFEDVLKRAFRQALQCLGGWRADEAERRAEDCCDDECLADEAADRAWERGRE